VTELMILHESSRARIVQRFMKRDAGEAVSLQRWPGFETRSGHVGFTVDKAALRHVLPANHSTGRWHNKPNCGYVPSGLSLTPTQKLIGNGEQ
jgi:hypothetical protein